MVIYIKSIVLLMINFVGVNMQTNDSGLASYVSGQVDQSLSWKVKSKFLS